MKATGTILSGFVILVAGVVLCILNSHPDILSTIVKIVGAAFAIAGIINMIIVMIRKRSANGSSATANAVGWLSGIAGIGLGCAMFFSPLFFTPVLVFLFGALLILGGLFQIIMLAWGYRPYVASGWLYVMPVLQIIGGVVMICSDTVRYDNAAMVLITGIGFIFYGLTSFMTLIGVASSRQKTVVADNSNENTAADAVDNRVGINSGGLSESEKVEVPATVHNRNL